MILTEQHLLWGPKEKKVLKSSGSGMALGKDLHMLFPFVPNKTPNLTNKCDSWKLLCEFYLGCFNSPFCNPQKHAADTHFKGWRTLAKTWKTLRVSLLERTQPNAAALIWAGAALRKLSNPVAFSALQPREWILPLTSCFWFFLNKNQRNLFNESRIGSESWQKSLNQTVNRGLVDT